MRRLRQAGTYPAVMNGANEELVALFLKGKIHFTDIQINIEKILDDHKPAYNLTLEDILEADRQGPYKGTYLCRGRTVIKRGIHGDSHFSYHFILRDDLSP